MKKNEEIVQLDTSNSNKNKKTQPKDEKTISLISFESPSSIKIKRKSRLQHSEKIDTKQDSPKQLDESMTSQFSRKLSKLHAPMECSTPKYNFPKHKLEFNIETPEALEKTQKNEDKLDNKSEIVQNTSSKKTKSKKSTKERNISLTDFIHQNKNLPEKSLNISLPTDLVKTMGKADNPSKMVQLHKTMSFTHTETPTIRHLRKEKLNESAPVLKLHLENLSKENLSTIEKKEREEKEDIEKIEMKEKDSEDVPNLEPSDNNKRKRKRQKKNKKQMEEALNENVDNLIEDTIELETSQERKRVKFNESPSVKNDICDDTSQINEGKKKKKRKKKKKKKEQTDVSKDSEKEADPHQKDRNETELMKHSEKNEKAKTSSNSESNANEHISMKEKSEQQKQEMVQSEETSLKVHKKKKQKKKEKAPLLETKEVSEEKSKKSDLNKIQSKNTELDTKNTTIAKMRQEMVEAIHAVEMRIKSKELEKKKMQEATEKKKQEAIEKKKQEAIEKKKQEAIEKKKQERAAQIQKQNLQEQNSKSKKRKKETAEKSAFASSSTGSLERLSNDVINLLPAKTTKRRKLSQNEKSVVPSQPKSFKSKNTKMKNISVQLSSSGSTTQFIVADLKKIKKEPSKISAAVTSFRQRMLDRNERQPISAYLMYLKKQDESLKESRKD